MASGTERRWERGSLQALVFLEVSRLESLRDIVRVLGSGKGDEGDECG
jgi:hypothetical protein